MTNLAVRIAACTEAGARSDNEDRVLHGQVRCGHFAVLTDGAGGHRRGAQAAQLAVDAVQRFLRNDDLAFAPNELSDAVRAAHAEVIARQPSGSNPPDARMHCTIVVLWIDAACRHVMWSHLGDSRLYRIRHGRTDVVTVDDSVVQQLVQSGVITPEQSRRHPHKNRLVAALGIEGEIHPHTVARPVELRAGDAFLLCSDGWWEGCDEAALVASLQRALSPEAWLEEMRSIVAAHEQPNQDNFSALAVWYGDPAEATPPDAEDTRPKAIGPS